MVPSILPGVIILVGILETLHDGKGLISPDGCLFRCVLACKSEASGQDSLAHLMLVYQLARRSPIVVIEGKSDTMGKLRSIKINTGKHAAKKEFLFFVPLSGIYRYSYEFTPDGVVFDNSIRLPTATFSIIVTVCYSTPSSNGELKFVLGEKFQVLSGSLRYLDSPFLYSRFLRFIRI